MSFLYKWVQQFIQRKPFPVIAFILIGIISTSGCSYLDQMRALNEPTARPISIATQVPAPTEAKDPTPLPTRVFIPMGLIRIPITREAIQTAVDLNSTEPPALDHYRLVQELQGYTSEELVPDIPDIPEYEINDRLDFIIDKDLAGDYRALPAILRQASENAYWWKGVTTQADDDEIIAAAHLFEEQILQMNRDMFGTEWSPGIDNDPRIHILLIDEPRWGDTIGNFNSIHEYPTSIEPYSNQKEIIFVNLGAVDINSLVFSGELAQEYHRMIHWNQDPNEEIWFTEAMSKLAAFLNGAPPGRKGSRLTNEDLFANDPATQLTSRPEVRIAEDETPFFPHFAAERLFAIYLHEQFGPQLIMDIVMNPAPGVMGIQQELAKLPGSPRFEDVFADWTVANLLNRTSVQNGQFGYQEIRPPPPYLEPVESFDGQPLADRLPSYGTRYYEVIKGGPVQVEFTGSTMARLTPADPASGFFAWYSNRGDNSEFTLTRIFDLSLKEAATLKFKVWYQLEEFYDYAYLEISVDGGRTWEILDTVHGTDKDPHNVALGTGYTGSTPDWRFDSVDLTSYTGQKVQIRFHVITDITTNRDGFQVDDITIPELNYFDGAEDSLGGWKADGFVRSSNFVPVEWIIWLVKSSNPTEIERIKLTPDQSAAFDINGFGEIFNQARIIIAPTSPITTMDIDYEINFKE